MLRPMRHLAAPLAAALSLLALAGCEQEPTYLDGLPSRPPSGGWIEVVPGGDTVCARGTPYRFFARGGDPHKVIIDFQGGGACWNDATCGFADSLFSDTSGSLAEFTTYIDDGVLGGIFDPDGPFRDYTIIHIPYCTGDIHWGNARVEYADGLTIEHKGFVNASTALDWIYTRYETPETILVSGCSAGAYGAALHSAYVADHYPDARIAVLADSGAGIITDSFLMDSLPNWNAEAALPPFIPELQVPLTELTLPDLYVSIGNHFPDMRMAQTATAYDADQIFFYTAMGGRSEDWPGLYRASLSSIEGALPSFRSYVPPGSVHCVSIYSLFDTRVVNGVALSDWTTQLVEGETIPDSVACEGADCCIDPACDACLAGSGDAWCRFCDLWPPLWSECAP